MIGDLKQFYAGKRVFLTGHTGFKGSWLALWLRSLGAEVFGFALPPENSRGNHFELIGLADDVRSQFGDIRDFETVSEAVQASRADIVFHLAAQALVRRSYRNPVENYAANVMGTVHVLEAVRQAGTASAVVNITTDKCYDNKEWEWPYREIDPLGGADPYSSSKACAELVTSAYRRSYFQKDGIAVATARAGNVIGGGDFAEDRIIPDIVEAMAADRPVSLRSPGSVRPWQHVLDALFGYLLLGMKLGGPDSARFQSAYNFSPARPENVTVLDITKAFLAAVGRGSYQVEADAAGLHEAAMLKLDPSKAMAELGWRPMWDAGTAVAFTAEWFADYLGNPQSARDISLRQLNQTMTFIEQEYSHARSHL